VYSTPLYLKGNTQVEPDRVVQLLGILETGILESSLKEFETPT